MFSLATLTIGRINIAEGVLWHINLRIQNPFRRGLGEIVWREIDGAVQELTNKEMDPHEGVHQARKRFKKIRAVLRLTRQELGEV